MRKIVVVKKMPIQFILFSILFRNLNPFHIIYKIPLQALASWECDCVFPSDRAQVRAAALFVFTPHCACNPWLLPVLLSPYTQIMEHFFLYFIWRAKCRVIHEIDVGKNKSFTACSLDCLALSFRQNYFMYSSSRLHLNSTSALHGSYCLFCSTLLKEICRWDTFQVSHVVCTDLTHQKPTHCSECESRSAGTLLSPNRATGLHNHFLFVYHLELMDLKRQGPSSMWYIAFSTIRV